MMRIALSVFILVFAAMDCLAADEELSPELKVLDRRIGTWKVETVVKPGVWVPDGAKSSGVETIEWTLGNKFIKGESRVDGPRGKSTNLHLMTWDPHQRVYRFWHFDSHGDFPRGEFTGQWDEKTNTVTFKNTLPNEVAVVVTMTYVDKDKTTWHGEWKDKDGQMMMEIDGKVTRVAADKKDEK